MAIIQSDNQPWIKSTCAYCGVGCGIEAQVTQGPEGESATVAVRGDESHPANYGRLCSKGLALGETVVDQGRLTQPQIHGQDSAWQPALQMVADKFSHTIAEHGPDSVAFYVSGQLLTEDYYIANKLMKGFIGSGNIDTNSRLCMSSSVAGHKRAFGTDTVPNTYTDLEQSDLVVLVGSNLAWCHPVLFQRLKAAKAARPEMRVVVIDPRDTETTSIADLYLPIKPGADVLLYNGLLDYLARAEKLDDSYIEQHTENFTHALNQAQFDCADRESFYAKLGLPSSLVTTFYRWVAETDKTLTVYSQGVNQSSAGADKVNAIINTHLATGRIGRLGCGPFSVTGQPNAMGGREVGGLANMLAAHLEFGNQRASELIKTFWDSANLATGPGLKAVEMFDAIADGKIKAVWVMATNPAASLPNRDKVKQALANCDFVVVSDCIADTDTTQFAHVLLPAQGWAEKSGTVTNSERRISRQRQIVPALGEAKPDWWIMSEVAKLMGFGAQFDYPSEADVFKEYAAMTALGQEEESCKRDLDISGLADITTEQYHSLAPVQWPVAQGSQPLDDQRFFAEGGFYTASRKGQFVSTAYRPPQTATNAKYPLILNSGRLRDQWHTMTRTGLSARLNAHKPEPFININPLDAQAYGTTEGAIVKVTSLAGSAMARARITTEVQPGQLFMPIHWTGTHSSHSCVSSVVTPEYDPVSGQPESKFTPVALSPWPVSSEALVLSRSPIAMPEDSYWARQTIEQGFLYFVASQQPPAELAASLSNTLPQQELTSNLGFTNSATGAMRRARIQQGQLIDCLIVAQSTQKQDYDWLAVLLADRLNSTAERSLLAGKPDASIAQGKLICACKKVGEKTIKKAITSQNLESVEDICSATQAGTGCGSCLPELGDILEQCQTIDA
ncbi:nitrate reductase [Halioxenophilus aromaticivorans]|uniref:Nitrate reductase n=1 Tax=Halioxenophilus aromaticivorans TaxID=1306992 RepID=A0AAV3U9B9_9ALTE